MKNDWFVSEETEGSNPDIFVESRSEGTICEITRGPLKRRRCLAALIAKAPALEQLPGLLESCDKAVAFYEWIIADWGAKVDPDGEIPQDLASFRGALERVRQALSDTPDLFEDL